MDKRRRRLRELQAGAVVLFLIGSSMNVSPELSFAKNPEESPAVTDELKFIEAKEAEDYIGVPLPEDAEYAVIVGDEAFSDIKAGDVIDLGDGAVPDTLDEADTDIQDDTDTDVPDEADSDYQDDIVPDMEGATDALVQGLRERQETIDLHEYGIPLEKLEAWFRSVINENPELIYVGGVDSYSSYKARDGIIQEVMPVYNGYTDAEVEEYKEALDRAYEEAVPDPENMSQMQIARACHDYLAQHVYYDYTYAKRSAYGALVEGTAVCEGYSRAYGEMLRKAGIEFDYTTSVDMAHMWNYVKIDDEWYHVDVTWDDPTAEVSGMQEESVQADKMGAVLHTYFLNSDEAIGKEEQDGQYHQGWEPVRECTSAKYDDAYWQDEGISAIFVIDGKEYYLKYTGADENGPVPVELIRREDDTETTVLTFRARWDTADGSGYWDGLYSSLSYYGGKLYFNDAKNIYSYDPAAESSEAEVIYRYTGDGDLYGSFIYDNKIMMTVAVDPNEIGEVEEEELPGADTEKKEPQAKFRFAASAVNKTYGDDDFAVSAKGAVNKEEVTYYVENPQLASIDSKTGKVHIKKAGETEIIAVAPETEEYARTKISCTLKVKKKGLDWAETDGLYAADKADNETGDKKLTAEATLYGRLDVTGILKDDDAVFDCTADKLSGTYVKVTPGAQKVKLEWRGEPVTLTGADAGNYALPETLPTVKGVITEVFVLEEIISEGGGSFRLEIETGITEVPEALKNDDRWNTILKINNEMKKELSAIKKSIKDENKVVYDVKLMVKDGESWTEATAENFPKDGLTVTIPYPKGTERKNHNFIAAHLFTVSMNGREAGEVERIKASAITKTDDGIQFVLHGLSPIAVGWEKTEDEEKPDTEAPKSSDSDTGSKKSSDSKSKTPKTGDNNKVPIYMILMLVSAVTAESIRKYRQDI